MSNAYAPGAFDARLEDIWSSIGLVAPPDADKLLETIETAGDSLPRPRALPAFRFAGEPMSPVGSPRRERQKMPLAHDLEGLVVIAHPDMITKLQVVSPILSCPNSRERFPIEPISRSNSSERQSPRLIMSHTSEDATGRRTLTSPTKESVLQRRLQGPSLALEICGRSSPAHSPARLRSPLAVRSPAVSPLARTRARSPARRAGAPMSSPRLQSPIRKRNERGVVASGLLGTQRRPTVYDAIAIAQELRAGLLLNLASSKNVLSLAQQVVDACGQAIFQWFGSLSGPALQTAITEAFNRFDKDGSGAIDREEFAKAMHALGLRLSSADLDMLFREYDADASGEIDLGEFSNMVLLLLAKGNAKRMDVHQRHEEVDTTSDSTAVDSDAIASTAASAPDTDGEQMWVRVADSMEEGETTKDAAAPSRAAAAARASETVHALPSTEGRGNVETKTMSGHGELHNSDSAQVSDHADCSEDPDIETSDAAAAAAAQHGTKSGATEGHSRHGGVAQGNSKRNEDLVSPLSEWSHSSPQGVGAAGPDATRPGAGAALKFQLPPLDVWGKACKGLSFGTAEALAIASISSMAITPASVIVNSDFQVPQGNARWQGGRIAREIEPFEPKVVDILLPRPDTYKASRVHHVRPNRHTLNALIQAELRQRNATHESKTLPSTAEAKTLNPVVPKLVLQFDPTTGTPSAYRMLTQRPSGSRTQRRDQCTSKVTRTTRSCAALTDRTGDWRRTQSLIHLARNETAQAAANVNEFSQTRSSGGERCHLNEGTKRLGVFEPLPWNERRPISRSLALVLARSSCPELPKLERKY